MKVLDGCSPAECLNTNARRYEGPSSIDGHHASDLVFVGTIRSVLLQGIK
jgi:hypothetical protein